MTRRSVRTLCAAAALLLVAGCSSLNPFASSKPKLPELAPVKPTVDLRLAWRGSVGASEEYVLMPAVVEGNVYAAGRNGSLVRYEGSHQVWSVRTETKLLSGGVGSDGKLVVVGSPKGDVFAYDNAGKLLWKARVSSEVLAPPAVSENGVVIVRTADSRLHGLDGATGERKWMYERPTPPLTLRSFGGIAVVGKTALAGFPGGKLLAINVDNGGALWEATVALPKGSTELERVADVTSQPALGRKEVCAAAYQGRVGCFQPQDGSAIWTRDISSIAGLDTDGRYVYVTDDKGHVHCIDMISGASVWRQDKLAGRGVTRPLVIGSHVVVGDSKGLVHVLQRSTGEFEARISTDSSGIKADPQRASDTGFLVQTMDGGLYALTVQ